MKYNDLRPHIITGHCILWQGNSFLSKIIRLYSKYSHASLVVRLEEYAELKNRVFLVEALATGLQLRLLSERIKNYNGKIFHLDVPIELDEQERIRAFALVKCAEGIRYDYQSLFKNAIGRVSMDAKRYFCSEFVWAAWQAVGIVRRSDKAPRPGDIPKFLDTKSSASAVIRTINK